MQCYTPYFDVPIQLSRRMKNSHPIPCMWGSQQARNHPEAPRRTGEASPTTNFGPWTVFGSSSLPGCPVPVTAWFLWKVIPYQGGGLAPRDVMEVVQVGAIPLLAVAGVMLARPDHGHGLVTRRPSKPSDQAQLTSLD
ncbi:hypothetical protein FSOLCH5_007012 [Fusarium solani]